MAISISWREHTAKDGKITRYARFRTPERKPDGSIGHRSVERSVGAVSKREGAKIVDEWYKSDLEAASTEPQLIPTFAEVALSYQRTQGASAYFAPILLEIGLKPITAIDQAVMMTVAANVYPGRTAATINRQLFTPVKAALRLQGELGMAIASRLKRPKGHDSLPSLDVPEQDWYRAVIPVANPWLRAFLLVGRLHGRRPGELLNRTREHFNAEERTLAVYDTKGHQHIVLQLAEPAWAALMAIPDLSKAEGLKGKDYRLRGNNKRDCLFGTNQKTTMRQWLIKACKTAKVRYHMPKEAGRHAFATGAIREGKSTAWLTRAGHWKSPKIPLAKYVHLEKQHVAGEAKALGENWFGNSVGAMPAAVLLLAKAGKGADVKPSQNAGTDMGTKTAMAQKTPPITLNVLQNT